MRSDELAATVFTADALERLARVADIVEVGVLTEFGSERARRVLADIDVLITCWGCPVIDAGVLDAAPRLRLVAHSAGTVKGHLEREVWDRGIAVTTAAQANGEPVAEYTLAFILLSAKGALSSARDFARLQDMRAKALMPGQVGNLGSTVGIIGASRIGRRVLELLSPFHHRRLISSPDLSPAQAETLGATLVPLDRLMAESDVVSLHAPVLPSTIGMIGRTQFDAMKTGATFINTARGVLVDHDALRHEAGSGRINAVLDVTYPEPLPAGDPLYGLPNVVLTPHIAGSMGNELPLMGDFAVAEVEQFAAGAPLNYPVTLADLERMA
ncbi:hydroxyacid dehydrogenase [Lacisediminihabitans profunda]|uniref:Hydroxyacid dehydrogenase n=1 Tax=Lacisediminihabitans profunda TaxID=2594790 RepID=A0A5C8URP5_9MICO|nr:hydroxyacid dehydrogenase [Lacisediminihabitans profunda]TXN30635.1 hydroxyacid dehydrogenase [Lacisediminihabitans profunda]